MPNTRKKRRPNKKRNLVKKKGTKKKISKDYEILDFFAMPKKNRQKYLNKFSKLSPFEFKDTLLKRAAIGAGPILNVGRGNPNFLNSFCRNIFAKLQLMAVELSNEISKDLVIYPQLDEYNYEQVMIKKARSWSQEERSFLINYIKFLNKKATAEGISKKEVLYDIIKSTLGCFYPVPPQIQQHLGLVCQEFMYDLVMRANHLEDKDTKQLEGLKMNPHDFDFFATEGAAAGILYVFNTLSENFLVNPGDSIAIITPIFSPYLEMPKLADYGERIVRLHGDPDNNYSLSDEEINKLKDKRIKALFMVNPTNPSSYSLSKSNIDKIGHIVNTERQDLIVLSDNVYAPFANQYNSFMLTCPRNTIEVFSLSKYFGTTGWRLGVIMVAKENRINNLFKKLPFKKTKALRARYEIGAYAPDDLTFMERLVFDSRQVAEEHVAGLSTPQQVLIGLFMFYELNDKDDNYNRSIKTILRDRITKFYNPLKTNPHIEPTSTNYYNLLFIPEIAENLYGKDARKYLEQNYDANEFLLHISLKYKVILLPGKGFGADNWRLRVSLANMATDQYEKVGIKIRDCIHEFVKPALKQAIKP